jgi:hypothetical protein
MGILYFRVCHHGTNANDCTKIILNFYGYLYIRPSTNTFIMKKVLTALVAALISCAAICQTSIKPKPTLTQAQWEAIVDAQKEYSMSKAKGLSDTTAKKELLVSSASHLAGITTRAQLEEKMEEFYGPNWKTSGGPLHTACQLLCGVTYSVCFESGYNILSPNWNYCEKIYRQCMIGCGLFPPTW